MIAERKDALAAPAAIISRDESSSTWSVLTATNRVRETGKNRAPRYGNTVGSEVLYSECRVTVPHIHHLDPIRGSKLSPLSSNPTKQVKLAAPRRLSQERFFSDLAAIVKRSPERDVFVFVHGFNADFERAVTRAAQIAQDMPFNGAVVCYSWPSQASQWKYKTDQTVADKSAPVLAEFLTKLGDRLPADVSLNIVAHSMGNRVLMQAMNQLPERFAYPRRFDEIVLAAPDVGVRRFEKLFPAIDAVSRRVTLYASDGDMPLIASWVVNQEQRAGDSARPVRIDRLDTVDVSRVDVGFMGHSYYGSNRSVLRDLFSVVKQHHPPETRYWLREKKRSAGTYFEFDTEVIPIIRVKHGVVQ
jgi:esterase/lipase superfamily enzyme